MGNEAEGVMGMFLSEEPESRSERKMSIASLGVGRAREIPSGDAGCPTNLAGQELRTIWPLTCCQSPTEGNTLCVKSALTHERQFAYASID